MRSRTAASRRDPMSAAVATAAQTRSNQAEAADEAERLRAFGARIDQIRARIEQQIGADDVAHVKKMRALSRAMEISGRALIHVSLDPVTFAAGVAALWLHKQLEATEIGHTALHGAFDKLPGADDFTAKTFSWRVPIDEESWLVGHNIRHHQYTNVAGRDADIHFGPVRLKAHPPPRPVHSVPLPIALVFPARLTPG